MGLIALGLNVVVGYAGLLDLGFVAFYGVGAYAYAYLSSDFSGLHLPTWLSLPLVTLVSALFGLLLGLPSLRLLGDYLAIVSLGFGLIFVQLMTSLTRVQLPGMDAPLNLTGGPNGIVNLDDLSLVGAQASTVSHYYLVMVIALGAGLILIQHLNQSRVGRAWRAMREDELAAAAMGMPIRRLKLQAFTIGAAIAGLSGALFAAWQGSVFPSNFETTLLVTLYAIIVLGGLGSILGVLLGAVVMIAVPEVLRNIELAGAVFYGGVILLLLNTLRPRWRTPVLLLLVILFGFALRLALTALFPAVFVPAEGGQGWLVDAVRGWLALPTDAVTVGNIVFVAVVIGLALVTRLQHAGLRFVALVPILYGAAFAWETRLSQEPSVTRLLFVGVLLVVLMIYRPQGLLGQKRVEVV
jgi:branched-chain amino acid transport system permease protein